MNDVPVGIDAAAVAQIDDDNLWVCSDRMNWEHREDADGMGGINGPQRSSTKWRRLVGPWIKVPASGQDQP